MSAASTGATAAVAAPRSAAAGHAGAVAAATARRRRAEAVERVVHVHLEQRALEFARHLDEMVCANVAGAVRRRDRSRRHEHSRAGVSASSRPKAHVSHAIEMDSTLMWPR